MGASRSRREAEEGVWDLIFAKGLRRIIPLIAVAAGLSASAEREQSLGDYSREIRSRIAAKVSEVLSPGGTPAEIEGTVTFSSDSVFFLQRGSDGLKVVADSLGALPSPGDVATVSGAPTLEYGHVAFVAKSWSKFGEAALPEPIHVGSADLVRPGIADGVNGRRVVVSGRAMGTTETGFAITVDNVPVNVLVDPLPDFVKDCSRTHPNVRAVGVVEQVLDESAFLGRSGYVMGVKVNVSSPKDVELLPDLEYYAARRHETFRVLTVTLSGGLGVVLLVFAVVYLRQQRRIFRSRTIMAERKRMADDIHDTIEQHLVGAGMLIRLNKLKEAQDVLARAKREVRDVVWGLKNDDMMRLSPSEMLRQLAHEETTKGIYRVDSRLASGLPVSMDAAQMRDLCLIVREAIGNAVKHGGAKKIAISSDPVAGGGWLLRVANDGVPFDSSSAPGPREGHFGLEGMRQRARRIGAELSLEVRGGWTVVCIECSRRPAKPREPDVG